MTRRSGGRPDVRTRAIARPARDERTSRDGRSLGLARGRSDPEPHSRSATSHRRREPRTCRPSRRAAVLPSSRPPTLAAVATTAGSGAGERAGGGVPRRADVESVRAVGRRRRLPARARGRRRGRRARAGRSRGGAAAQEGNETFMVGEPDRPPVAAPAGRELGDDRAHVHRRRAPVVPLLRQAQRRLVRSSRLLVEVVVERPGGRERVAARRARRPDRDAWAPSRSLPTWIDTCSRSSTTPDRRLVPLQAGRRRRLVDRRRLRRSVPHDQLRRRHAQRSQKLAKSEAHRRRGRRAGRIVSAMAKDTEKLIRQLSLISYLMAERRPVTALEIRRDVEGYSTMNEDAFARRFYADRSELDSLGIVLTVERPVDGVAEQENYSLRPGELPPPGDRLHRRRAGGAADGAVAARRRVRLRRAAAPRAAADLLGAREPAARARAARRRARDHRVGRRARPLAAPGEDRDGDLPQQDDHVRLLHDGARRDRHAQGRPVPPALPGRPVLPPRPLPRARRAARLPAVAHPGQGRLRDEVRARLQGPSRRASTRAPTPTAPSGSSATPTRPRRSRSPSGSPGRSSATSAASARSRPRARARRRHRLRDAATPIAGSSPRGCCASASTPACSARRSSSARSPSASSCCYERHRDGPDGARTAFELAAPVAPAAARSRRRGVQRQRAPRRGGDPPGAHRAPRDARVDPHPGRPRRRAPAGRRRSASRCRSPTPSCARTSTCSTS